MLRPFLAVLCMTALAVARPPTQLAAAPAGPAPAQVDPDLIWDLTPLYPSLDAWHAERERIIAAIPALESWRGRLGESAAVLREALDATWDLRKDFARLSIYANLRADENTRDPANLALRQQMGLLGADFSRAVSYQRPEMLALGDDTLHAFLAAEPGLAPYRYAIETMIRQRPHSLGDEAERVLSQASLATANPSAIYHILANADVPWPTVTLADGSSVRLDQAGYVRHRAAAIRADRETVFAAFWATFAQFERTFGTTLFSQLKSDLFLARARHYPSTLAATLLPQDIPEAVYRTLVDEVNAHLPALHRYFRLRGRLLGVEDLRYHDIYPPLVELDRTFPVAEGRRLVLESAAPLGRHYTDLLAESLAGHWTHYPALPHKRSGAYASGGAYDVHPYVLVNYQDTFDSVTTLAHEWGHGLHSRLANATQPYPTAGYSLFVAEIAAIVNELLLQQHMLRHARTEDDRLYYLGHALERIRGTFWRQTMFAEFELAIHERVGRGESLTGADFSRLYGELLKRHHGHAEGVLTIDDPVTREWAFIPHFYRRFYVYQYATSIAAAHLFARRILAGEPGAREAYLDLLRAGGSAPPYELVKRAGVDLATPEAYRALVAHMHAIMDEIESILARRGATPRSPTAG
jgi:oligoendopeptidase F